MKEQLLFGAGIAVVFVLEVLVITLCVLYLRKKSFELGIWLKQKIGERKKE